MKQTDASEYGPGAVLIQDGRPIAFASKILTNVKTDVFAFGLEKFYTYIYGRHIAVHNDHKSLEMIQKKPIQAAPP